MKTPTNQTVKKLNAHSVLSSISLDLIAQSISIDSEIKENQPATAYDVGSLKSRFI